MCSDCNQDMTTAVGCTLPVFVIDGVAYIRRRCTRRRCEDCGAKPKHFHHLGCDLERCPRCTRQLLSCGCWNEGMTVRGEGVTSGWPSE